MDHSKLTKLTGVGPGLAEWIANHFGSEAEALAALSENPYRLMEVEGIGFRRADRIAQAHFGISPDDPIRHGYGNDWVLRQAGGRMPLDLYQARRMEIGLFDRRYELWGAFCDILLEPDLQDSPEFAQYVWLEPELRAEQSLARFLVKATRPTTNPFIMPNGIPTYLNEAQVNAVLKMSCPGFVPALCVTGGAGTGKTTVIAEAVRRLGAGAARIMTFTGKAAQRVRQALTGRGCEDFAEVSTLHRGLDYKPGEGFRRERFTESVVIIDEASMVPNWLLAQVVTRLEPLATLVLVGDVAQLPPIDAGFPFKDFIDAGVHTVTLTQNYRQENQREIFELAEAVRTRALQPPPLHASICATNLSAYEFNYWCEALLDPDQLPPLLDWQAITYRNADRERINLELQKIFNPHGGKAFEYWPRALPKEERKPITVKTGDKIAVRANVYSLEVMNGQTGIVRDVKLDRETYEPVSVIVEIEGRSVEVPLELAPDLLELGYCITTHKAQGSGWKEVFILQPGAVGFDSRRWWYTAISRAEEQLAILTQMGTRTWWANATKPMPFEPSSLLARFQRYASQPVGVR